MCGISNVSAMRYGDEERYLSSNGAPELAQQLPEVKNNKTFYQIPSQGSLSDFQTKCLLMIRAQCSLCERKELYTDCDEFFDVLQQ